MLELEQSLPIDISDLYLSEKELRFVGEYCANGFNEIDALRTSGFINKNTTPAQARLAGLEITNKSTIKTAIQRFTESVLAPYRDRLELQELNVLRARAYYNINMFYNSDGSVKPLQDIPTEWQYAIDDISEDFKGKDANVRTVKYKLADRNQAQKALKELLKKGAEDETEESNIPSDKRKFLQDLFQKGATVGAQVAIDAFKQGTKEKKAESITIVPDEKPIVTDIPKPVNILNSPKLQEVLNRRKSG